jgi:hypothetical protein
MLLSTTIAAPLVPTLADATNKRLRHAATTLQPGDQLHLTAPILGFPKGCVRAIYGYCVHSDAQGHAYAVTAYVRPFDLGACVVAFAERDARRYPTTNQQECWFGEVLMYLTEIDLTDYADCLRLERLSERVTPLLPAAITINYRQAA